MMQVEINPGIPPPIHYEVVSFGSTVTATAERTATEQQQLVEEVEAGVKKRQRLLHHGGSSATAVYNTLTGFDYVLIGVELV